MPLWTKYSDLRWNDDFVKYDTNRIGSGLEPIEYLQKDFIRPFIDAMNERYIAAGFNAGLVYPQEEYSGLTGYVATPYYLLNISLPTSAPSSGFNARPVITPIENAIDYQSDPNSAYGNLSQTFNNIVPAPGRWNPSLPNSKSSGSLSSYRINQGNIKSNFTGTFTITGVGWGNLQTSVAQLSRYYINNLNSTSGTIDYSTMYADYKTYRKEDNVTYQGWSFNAGLLPFYPALKPTVRLPYRSLEDFKKYNNPSGIISLSPSICSEVLQGGSNSLGDSSSALYPILTDFKQFNDTPIYDGSLLVSLVPSGMTLDDSGWADFNGTAASGLPHYLRQSYQFLDKFPYPSGFTRKFPREIWALENEGQNGQIAQFVAMNPDYNPQLPINGLNAARVRGWWYGSNTGSGYGKFVMTPSGQSQHSNKVFKYISSSGWVLHDDQQTTFPDILTEYGFAVPGDLMGPWILNDLRDAINQMVWNYGVVNAGSNIRGSTGIVYDRERQIRLMSYPSYYGVSTSKNFSDQWENTIRRYHLDDTTSPLASPANLTSTYNKLLTRYSSVSGLSSGITVSPSKFVMTDIFVQNSSDIRPIAKYMHNSYAYIKPSGIPLANGMQRKYEFYALPFPYGASYEQKVNESIYPQFNYEVIQKFIDYDSYGLQFTPTTNQLTYGNSASGAAPYSPSGTSGRHYMYKFGELTTDHEGIDIGAVFGDTSLSSISQSYYGFGNSGGWKSSEFIIISKFDMPNGSGFKFTKYTN